MILRPSKTKPIQWLLMNGAFLALALWWAQEIGWRVYPLAGIFGCGVLTAVVQLIPGSAYLQIADEGLSFAQWFRVVSLSWNTIDEFFVVAWTPADDESFWSWLLRLYNFDRSGKTAHEVVGFNFVLSHGGARRLCRVNAVPGKCEAALPDLYGQNAEDLAALLNHCIAQFRIALLRDQKDATLSPLPPTPSVGGR